MVFPWRSTKGVKPDALKGASPVLKGGDEETGLCRPRLVATQLECEKAYVLIDNAPMHRSKAFIRHIPKWVTRGLIIKYLPSYSPELNLIEILWRFIKYYWLPFSAYGSFQQLCAAVEEILQQFGTKYTIDFQAA
jgi:DDE superfamily endonuclease